MERNFGSAFSVFGRVDLGQIYEEWREETDLEAYREPTEGWDLKYGYVFMTGVCALLFENASREDETYYRVLLFRGEGEGFGLFKKVRFRESAPFRVLAIGIDWDLNALLVRRAGGEVRRDIYCTGIGEQKVDVGDFENLLNIVVPQSDMGFVLADGMNVLFIRMPAGSALERGPEDPHDLLCFEECEETEEFVCDSDGFEDEDEDQDEDREENGDETECQAEARRQAEGPGKSASDELHEMIGLDGIKEKIDQIVAFARLRKMAKEQGRKVEGINLNLSFLGNPGTAKTTVARLFARIMKENGVLSKGELVEVGRADLVAKYTGQTAIKVKGVFDKAQGSVLFIDEAYSLIDGWENEFGDEAIATIVQEMENRREDMIVIFAGYPDKMEQFLSRNPGLRSRVPFLFRFEDYSADELTAIAKSEAARRGYAVTGAAERKIREICESATKTEEFGNGRFSRNLVEAAIMRAASRAMGAAAGGDLNAFFTLEESDFAAPDNLKKKEKKRTIGFDVA